MKSRKRTHIVRPFSLSIKSIYRFYFSCGSTHKIEFAVQIPKIRGHVPRSAAEKPHKDSVRIFDL